MYFLKDLSCLACAQPELTITVAASLRTRSHDVYYYNPIPGRVLTHGSYLITMW